MANSTSNLDTISSGQSQKEITANALFDAMSQASTYGRRASTTTALTWGYYGGNVTLSSGSHASISNGTLALSASTTNYVVADKTTGAVSSSTSTTNWNDAKGYWRLYSVVTGASTISSYTDYREPGRYQGSDKGLEYNAGSGGTQTQTTDKATGVTLNKRCGQITMNNATLNAGTSVSFTLTNSEIATSDIVSVCIASGATANAYFVGVDAISPGSCRIHLRNVSASNLGEALVLGFAVIKGILV